MTFDYIVAVSYSNSTKPLFLSIILKHLYIILLGERSETLNNESEIFVYIYGKVQRGQCMSTPRGNFKTLTLAQVEEFQEKRL